MKNAIGRRGCHAVLLALALLGTPITMLAETYTASAAESVVMAVPSQSSIAVTSITLINADTNQPISGFDPLPNNATINLATLPTRRLNVRINTTGSVGSVKMVLDGGKINRTENSAPFALAGDTNGDYAPWTLAQGSHTLVATAYTRSSAAGSASAPLTIKFNAIDQVAPAPTAAPTQQPAPTAAPTQQPAPTAAPTQQPAPTAAPTQQPAPNPAGGSVVGKSRGYLTTPQELQTIRQKASAGIQPYAANVSSLISHAGSPTAWVSQNSIGGQIYCSDGSQKDGSGNTLPRGPVFIVEGGRLIYAKALAAHLSGNGEAYARDIRARLLDLTDTTFWGGESYSGGNQCILYLSWFVPQFINAADLLEAYPQVWSAQDKRTFQGWLASQVYKKVAWSSRVRMNNWGAGGSYAAAVIADYLWDSGLTLQEVSPSSRTLSPGQAYTEHLQEQLRRMSTTVTSRDGDAACLPYKGIQSHGGIPEELRRAKISSPLSMCTASYLPAVDGAYGAPHIYQITHVEALIGTAELALRRGNRTLYDNIAADGSGSILRAIKFVIQNPVNPAASYDWDAYRKAQLHIAYRYYRDPAIARRLSSNDSSIRSGELIAYGRVTHAFAANESPALPPTVPPAR